jgi:hypothetical protein
MACATHRNQRIIARKVTPADRAHSIVPEASKEQMDRFNELQRKTATTEGAARFAEAWGEIVCPGVAPEGHDADTGQAYSQRFPRTI